MLREVAAEAGPADAVAITMTAELSDAFRTKREGVAFVLDAAEDALGDRRERADDGRRARVRGGGARAAVGRRRRQLGGDGARGGRATHPDALLIDVGSTTADVVPIAARPRRGDRAQRPGAAAGGRARLHRRAAHQPRGDRAARAGPRRLVPGGVGVLRDQRRRPPRPRPSDAGGVRLPDARRPPGHGRRSRASASPGWCAPTPSSSTRGEIDAIAAFLHGEQVRQIEAAARRVQRPLPPDGARRRGRLRRLPGARGRRAARASGRRRAHGARPAGRGARRAAGGAPVLTVVKVGGGLGRTTRCRRVVRRRSASSPSAIRCSSCPAARVRRRRARRRPPLRAARGDRAPHGDPRHGAVRLAAERADPGARRRSVRACRAELLRAATDAARVVAGDLRLDRRLGRRRVGAERLVLVKGVDGLFAEWPASGEPLAS